MTEEILEVTPEVKEELPAVPRKRRAPVARMPKSVNIGAHVYKIHKVKELLADGEPAHGMLDDGDCVIHLTTGMSKTKAQEVILHEILHALFYRLPHESDTMTEEDFVGHTAPNLLSVLQTNPQLVKYLTNVSE